MMTELLLYSLMLPISIRIIQESPPFSRHKSFVKIDNSVVVWGKTRHNQLTEKHNLI